MEGREKALARGVKFGADFKLTNREIQDLVKDVEAPDCSKTEIAEAHNTARPTVNRLYAEKRQREGDVQAVH